jgi:hypothetical protein
LGRVIILGTAGLEKISTIWTKKWNLKLNTWIVRLSVIEITNLKNGLLNGTISPGHVLFSLLEVVFILVVLKTIDRSVEIEGPFWLFGPRYFSKSFSMRETLIFESLSALMSFFIFVSQK